MIIIITILLVVILFLVYFRRTQEDFTVKYQLVNGNQLTDDRFQIYNQNYNQPWKESPQAYNSPIVQTYGTSFNDMYKMNQYIFNDFEKKDLDKFVKEYSQPARVNLTNYKLDYTPFDIYNMNKSTWFNKFNWNPDYVLYQRYVNSDFTEINTMNKFFLYMFNKFWFDFITDYVKRKTILYKPYFILKHRIVNIYSSNELIGKKPKTRYFETVVVVTRDDAILAFEFMLSGLFLYNPKKNMYDFDKMGISYTSNYQLDKLLLRQGLDKNNLEYNLNPLWKNDTSLSSAEAKKIYSKEKKKVLEERDFLDYSYSCFTFNKRSNDPYSTPIFATDKNDCEDAYDIIGYKKPSGVWDRPCLSDKECIYNGANKNYPNQYGRCINGTCQMPSNMRNLGYHYYIDSKGTKPLCYNCKSKKWLPNTKMDFCCDDQKNNPQKYPFLKSPDYAFEGDSVPRYNAYMQKQCRMKPNYDNIFKDTNVWKIDCKGFLDSYLVKSTDKVN